ncbi:MAG TPA: PDZ domain-containing protein [Allosphingosinicella sp.]|nr:PDZ domain-containing protein [Allosphingosinicella sp.]
MGRLTKRMTLGFAASLLLAAVPAQAAAQAAPRPASFGIQYNPHAEGIEIGEMLPDRTAAAVGMKVGDIIIEAGGKSLADQSVLGTYLGALKEGDVATFKVKRAGQTIELSGKAVAKPEGAPSPINPPK